MLCLYRQGRLLCYVSIDRVDYCVMSLGTGYSVIVYSLHGQGRLLCYVFMNRVD